MCYFVAKPCICTRGCIKAAMVNVRKVINVVKSWVLYNESMV